MLAQLSLELRNAARELCCGSANGETAGSSRLLVGLVLLALMVSTWWTAFDLWPGLTVTLSSWGTQPLGRDADFVGAGRQVFNRELTVHVGCHAGGDTGLYIRAR